MCILYTLLVSDVVCRPIQEKTLRQIVEKYAEKYAEKYGTLVPEGQIEKIVDPQTIKYSTANQPEEIRNFKETVKSIQTEAGLVPTGIVDQELANLVKSPRCGVFETALNPGLLIKRTKRFVIQGSSWKNKNPRGETVVTWTWDAQNYNLINTNLSISEILSVFNHAFKTWEKDTMLKFKFIDSTVAPPLVRSTPPSADRAVESSPIPETEVDIIIGFKESKHGDKFDFDGEGNILAHAFYPGSGIGGDIHFDLAETWSIYYDETDLATSSSLLSVAVHEIGHSLGLGHSSQRKSAMFPWYNGKIIHLEEDDKIGVSEIYGARSKWGPIDLPITTTTRPITTTTRPITTTTRPITTTTRKKFKKLPTRIKPSANKIFIQNSSIYVPRGTNAVLTF
jgi:hypothetical protein